MSPLSKKIVRLKAELIEGSERYDGIIESFTDDSINFITARWIQTELTPKSPVEIRFQAGQGEEMTLNCTLQWSYKTPPHGLTKSVSMKIMDLSSEYEEFYKSLG